MKAWELVQHLNEQMQEHGRELDVILYDTGSRVGKDSDIPDFEVEYNTDGPDPVILLSY